MNKPRPKESPKRQDPAKFIQSTTHRIRMEFVMEFSSNVTFARSREVARRLIDGFAIQAAAKELPVEFELSRLVCPELRRTIRVTVVDE